MDLLAKQGARGVQVRPVARAGRGKMMREEMFFTSADQARLYLVVLALQDEFGDAVKIHCDIAPAEGLWRQRDAYAALLANGSAAEAPILTATVIASSSSAPP